MTETPTAAPAKKTAKKSAGLSSMLLADLKSMAAGLGVAGAATMKKAQLVDAIKATQSGAAPQAERPAPTEEPRADQRRTEQVEQPRAEEPRADQPRADQPRAEQPRAEQAAEQPRVEPAQPTVRTRTRKQRQAEQAAAASTEQPAAEQDQQNRDQQNRDQKQDQQQVSQKQQAKQDQQKQGDQQKQDQKKQQAKQDRQQQDRQQQDRNQVQQGQDDDEDDEGGSRRNRRRRGRDRDRTPVRAGNRNEPDTTILEDDVLVPAAGILDVLDNCAFVRTSGYLPGPEDVYLSLSMVRKYHLRRGDAVVGQVRQPREGERREKFNPMVRIDSVNGTEAEGAKERPEFSDAVPVHPHQRLRLATDENNLIGRVVDIAAPVGKGQRGLVLAPPRSGVTSLMQSIAQSVTTNNPECHVMVVLVDTRPEEVTDFQRAVKGEVVASTFDRQPADHTLVAELAIERAKRLVELGHDVVVLLDSLTRLGRAYNLAAPANGRILGGLVDASAVHPTKEFFGAARKLEDAGSLTILATVSVGTGSATDEFFLEELEGTANLELVLSAERAAKGLVPAVDVAASGTRHEDRLLAPAEGAVVGNLRKQLAAADSPEAVAKVFGSR
ncbi:MAG TPA: transcription termination factor Rho [Nocardioides sp.]|nr:transcription termination factor Rho [Nocardioides sp.]